MFICTVPISDHFAVSFIDALSMRGAFRTDSHSRITTEGHRRSTTGQRTEQGDICKTFYTF